MLRQQKKRLNVPIEVLSHCAHRLSFSDQSIESSCTSSAWGATISFARVQRNIILPRVCPRVERQFPPSGCSSLITIVMLPSALGAAVNLFRLGSEVYWVGIGGCRKCRSR